MSVYIITDRAVGLCKIGYSATPLRRLSTLRCASASDLLLEGVIPAARQGERDLHRRFNHLRRAREWFALDGEIDALIAAFPAGRPKRRSSLCSSGTDPEACAIIDALGGTSAVAKLVEAPVSTVHSWRTIGIPQSRRSHLRLAAIAAEIPVPAELTPSEARAA